MNKPKRMTKIRILLPLLFLSFSCLSFSQNIISFGHYTVAPLEEFAVEIHLDNSDNFVAFQVDIPIPQGFSYVNSSAQFNQDRINGHLISTSIAGDNTLKIIAYHLNNEPFVGNSGRFITFRLKAPAIPASQILSADLALLSNTQSENILTSVSAGSVTVLAPCIELLAESLDFTRIALQSSSDKSFQITNTGNTTLTVNSFYFTDPQFSTNESFPIHIAPQSGQYITVTFTPAVKGIYNEQVIISSNDSRTPLVTLDLRAIAYAVNEIHAVNFSGASGSVQTLNFTLNNREDFTGFQFDLTLPASLGYQANSARLFRQNGHAVSVNMVRDTILRVVAFSVNNSCFSGNDGVVLSLDFAVNGIAGNYPLNLSNVIIVDTYGENIVSGSYNARLTVTSPDIHVDTDLDFGDVSILEAKTKAMRINNVGQEPLLISGVLIDNPYFSCNQPFPFQVEANSHYDLDITFQKNSKGAENTTILLFSNDPDEVPYRKQLIANAYAPNYINILSRHICQDETRNVEVEIINAEDFVAFQFDLSFPEGLTPDLTGLELTDRKTDHTFSANIIAENIIRVLAFSPTRQEFSGENGAVLQIPFIAAGSLAGEYSLMLSNVVISNGLSQNIVWGQTDGIVSVLQPQVINFESLSPKFYGDADFILSATATSCLAVSYESSNPDVAVVSGNVVTVVGAGQTTITATQKGNDAFCEAGEVTRVLIVEKATLQITAGHQTKYYGEENPVLTYTISGFVHQDTQDDLDVLPEISTTAIASSPVGNYAITVANANDNHYDFVYQNGNLEILKATLQVTADHQTKYYGEENPALTYAISGFVHQDTQDDLDVLPEISTTATVSSPVGNYAITVENASDDNYDFEYQHGILEILPIGNSVIIVPQTVNYGETANIEIEIENQATFVAFQFDLHFPQGLTVDPSDIELTDRKADHTFSSSFVNDTILRVLVFSLSQQAFSGNSGAVLVIPLETNDVLPGIYDLFLQNLVISDINSQPVFAAIQNSDLTIQKLQQAIEVTSPVQKMYGDLDFTLTATASSGLTVAYESSNPDVAVISGNLVTIVGAGQTTVFVSQSGNEIYSPAETMEISLQVQKADLIIIADDKTRFVGEENPEFTMSFQGFQYDDNEEDLDELPEIHCEADETSAAGNYEIYLTGGNDTNYEITLQQGVLRIENGVGIEEFDSGKVSILIYPNPTRDKLYLDMTGLEDNNLPFSVFLFDITGKMVGEYHNSALPFVSSCPVIDIANLKPGAYQLKVMIENHILPAKKIIKL